MHRLVNFRGFKILLLGHLIRQDTCNELYLYVDAQTSQENGCRKMSSDQLLPLKIVHQI